MENGAIVPKYYGKWSICSKRANAPFSIIFLNTWYFKGNIMEWRDKALITTKVICFIICWNVYEAFLTKQCIRRSSLISVHTVCPYTYISKIMLAKYAADDSNRQQFQMIFFAGAFCVSPLYINGFFFLVWYNKLGIVHCTYLGVSGYNF